MTQVAIKDRPSGNAALERLEALCDPGSLRLLRTGVTSPRLGEKAASGDGVLAGNGLVSGRPVFCYSQDSSYLGGSLGAAHADSICRVMELAERGGAPVVGFVASGGARLQEGHAALDGYGQIFRRSVRLSKLVPQISIVNGISAGGGAYSPALTDFIVMSNEGRMFLTGPRVVKAALGEDVTMEELGGSRLHGKNGVVQFTVDTEKDASDLTRKLLGYLPQQIGEKAPLVAPVPPTGDDPASFVPSEGRRVYDVRDVARAIVDGGEFLEVSSRWATNMVTGLARIEGRAVAIVANQPKSLGGVIDAEGAEKAAQFIERADRFGLPLVVLVDTPGFMPGLKQERAGVIRHGASLLKAFGMATVPKLTVALRKAYGGAVITMNSRGLGADVVFAWPTAEIGIMAALPAVEIVHRRHLMSIDEAESERTRQALADAYAEEHLGAEIAASAGFVDEVIEPSQTRERIADTLTALSR
jgi:acetyl-CoA carboxylase carboxyltransferase component